MKNWKKIHQVVTENKKKGTMTYKKLMNKTMKQLAIIGEEHGIQNAEKFPSKSHLASNILRHYR